MKVTVALIKTGMEEIKKNYKKSNLTLYCRDLCLHFL